MPRHFMVCLRPGAACTQAEAPRNERAATATNQPLDPSRCHMKIAGQPFTIVADAVLYITIVLHPCRRSSSCRQGLLLTSPADDAIPCLWLIVGKAG